MDKKSLRLYYTYFIPITIIQSLTSLAMMSFLTVADYGQYTLYLSAINFFFFLTLGIQNGYTLMIKDQTLNANETGMIANVLSITCLLILLISLPVLNFIPIGVIYKLAYLSSIMNVMYIFHKSVLRTQMKIHRLNIYIILFRLIAVLDIVIYILFKDIYILFLSDVFARGLLSILGTIAISIDSEGRQKIQLTKVKDIFSKLIIAGMPIMIGNWLISAYTIFDKTFLSSDHQILGLYSFSITSVLLLRVILIPISELYFVTLNPNETNKSYYRKLNLMLYVSAVFAILAAVGATILIKYLGVFDKYIEALPSLLILLNVLPLSVSLDVYVYNYLRRADGKRFMVYGAVGAFVTALILYVYTSLFSVNLVVYSYLVYFTYLIIYLLYIKAKLPLKPFLKITLKIVTFTIVFSLLCMLLVQI